METENGDPAALLSFRPVFGTGLYRTQVDVTGNHLSGLLLIKQMPDSSLRLVFSNEMGFRFFDFAFEPDGRFTVHSIIDRMNKKAVIKTLRKDFELVLMNQLDTETAMLKKSGANRVYVFPKEKGYYTYFTDLNGDSLLKMQRNSKRKAVVEAVMFNRIQGIYDSIAINHLNFNFSIALKRIER